MKISSRKSASPCWHIFTGVVLCGVYPLTVWVLAQGLFPARANGSLIKEKAGSAAQADLARFADPSISPRLGGREGHDATGSGGSNLGPTSIKLIDESAGAFQPIERKTTSLQATWFRRMR